MGFGGEIEVEDRTSARGGRRSDVVYIGGIGGSMCHGIGSCEVMLEKGRGRGNHFSEGCTAARGAGNDDFDGAGCRDERTWVDDKVGLCRRWFERVLIVLGNFWYNKLLVFSHYLDSCCAPMALSKDKAHRRPAG